MVVSFITGENIIFTPLPFSQSGLSRAATARASHTADAQKGLAVNKNPLLRTQSASASVVMSSGKEGSSKERAEEVARKVVWSSRERLEAVTDSC